MIDISVLTERLANRLNAGISEDNLNGLLPNTLFEFAVSLDTANYKKATRDGNTVTYYINALVKVISSETEGATKGAYNASMQVGIEFLIPQLDYFDAFEDIDGNSEILLRARKVIGNALQLSTSDDPITEGNVLYEVIAQFRIASTGMRMMREEVGDSITLTVYGTYVFVANGVSSSKIQLFVGSSPSSLSRVYYSTLGLMRQTTSEANYAAGDADTGAKATPQNTVLSIAVTGPLRQEIIDDAAITYLVEGTITPIYVELVIPRGSMAQAKGEYTMMLDNTGISAQQGLAASTSFKLIEYREG